MVIFEILIKQSVILFNFSAKVGQECLLSTEHHAYQTLNKPDFYEHTLLKTSGHGISGKIKFARCANRTGGYVLTHNFQIIFENALAIIHTCIRIRITVSQEHAPCSKPS